MSEVFAPECQYCYDIGRADAFASLADDDAFIDGFIEELDGYVSIDPPTARAVFRAVAEQRQPGDVDMSDGYVRAHILPSGYERGRRDALASLADDDELVKAVAVALDEYAQPGVRWTPLQATEVVLRAIADHANQETT